MLFTTPLSIDEHIIAQLGTGSIKTTELISSIEKARPQTTKQAVYAALRNLKKEEVIISHGMKSSLNIRWLSNIEKYLTLAQQKYHAGSTDKGSFSNLKNGERIEYFFNNLTETDAFWWQALYQLVTASSTFEPVYLYNPHQWFLLARRESELDSITSITTKNKQYLLTAAGNTALDKLVASDFDGTQAQYYMSGKHLFKKINYYFNVVDDFLIEVWINPELAQKVENFYTQTQKTTDRSIDELKEIVSIKGKGRLVISRDINKTIKLKKMLSKHFYVKHQ